MSASLVGSEMCIRDRYFIGSDSEDGGDVLLDEEEPSRREPRDGAWAPVRRRRRAGRAFTAATEAGSRGRHGLLGPA
eukprot:3228935-Alexandrium_andersonii.AAC.1